MRIGKRALALSVVAALGAAGNLIAEEPASGWPQFRGADRDGRSPETGLLGEWPEEGPRELWRMPIGEGYSGLSIVGDRLFTMFAIPAEEEGAAGTEVAAAFEAATGKEIWRREIGPKYDTEFGNGPRSTPTVDGDTVFVLGSHGALVALEVETGSERWRLELTESFGSTQPGWGFVTSPIVDGDLLIVQAGGAEGKSHVGLDKTTGEMRWAIGEGNGYNSPLAITMHGQRQYVYVTGGKLAGIDPEGRELWAMEWPRGETHATPVFLPPDRIYVSGAEGVGAAMVRITPAGEGPGSVEKLWSTNTLRNHFNQSIVHQDHIYGFDNATLKCVTAEDAGLVWRKRGLGKGSLVFAEGRLYVLSDQGRLVMLEATPDGYRERGTVQALQGKSWTPPTLVNGRIYLRNHTEMVGYDIQN